MRNDILGWPVFRTVTRRSAKFSESQKIAPSHLRALAATCIGALSYNLSHLSHPPHLSSRSGKLTMNFEVSLGMRIVLGLGLSLVFSSLSLTISGQAPAPERYWPQWRGPHANGISRQANPPSSGAETKNIRWKVEIPGRGSSSPVIWGDRVFILTAIPAGTSVADSHVPRGGVSPRGLHRYVVMALDRRDGRIVWERTAREEAPHEASHQDNGTWASASAVTDGQHVIASFESRGIYAYDMNGKLVWEKDLGDKSMRNEFGEGSTPTLYRNHLVVVWDHTEGSFVTVLDKNTGKELWRVSRNEIDTWATPFVVEHAGRAQVIVPGMNRLHSYDLETGEVVWHSQGLTMNPIPSPVGEDGIVIATSGFRGNNLKAIRIADAKGDLTGLEGDRVVARSRHAVRAVACSL